MSKWSNIRRPDSRGPIRTILAIESRTDITMLTLSCDHVQPYAQHFTYRVGASDVRCYACGQLELAKFLATQAR